MLAEATQHFQLSVVNQQIVYSPVDESVMENPLAIGALLKLLNHKQNTIHLLTQPDAVSTSVVAVDIETTALKPQDGVIRMVSVYGKEQQLVTEDVAQVASLLADETKLKVFHNAAFDVAWLKYHGFDVRHFTDTMIMSQVLNNTAKSTNTLQALALQHLGIVLDKSLQADTNWHDSLSDEHRTYALNDAKVTYQLYERLSKLISEKSLEVVVDREIRALPALIELNLNGIPFDYNGWEQVLHQLAEEAEALETEIRQQLNEVELNLSSPIQLKQVFEKQGITLVSTTDEALSKYETQHSAIALLRRYKKLKKQLSTYGEKLKQQLSPDSRLYGHWRLIGTDTSRMSCKEPNLQGLPTLAKPFVKAPEGYTFIVADYSTIELRILAEITQDAEMMAAFKSGEDLHSKTARAIFEKQNDEAVSSDERKIGKVINFGLIYGMTAYGLQKKVEAATGQPITLVEANHFRNKYFELYPSVLRYQDKMLKAGHIATLGGRYWSNDTTTLKAGAISRFNYPIQGTGAEGLKEALAYLTPQMQPDWKLIAAVHDEIVLQVKMEDAEEAKHVLEKSMKQGMQLLILTIPIEVDINITPFWAK